jgi:rhodanese-related sulfurtransferase
VGTSGQGNGQGNGQVAGLHARPATPRIDVLLEAAREGMDRLTPAAALAAQHEGALLVDTRTPTQRASQGELVGALVIDRTILEWRLDPTSLFRIPEARAGRRVVVVCRQGYSSSLAAASLRSLGVDATDVIGGAEAWFAEGMPRSTAPADVRH